MPTHHNVTLYVRCHLADWQGTVRNCMTRSHSDHLCFCYIFRRFRIVGKAYVSFVMSVRLSPSVYMHQRGSHRTMEVTATRECYVGHCVSVTFVSCSCHSVPYHETYQGGVLDVRKRPSSRSGRFITPGRLVVPQSGGEKKSNVLKGHRIWAVQCIARRFIIELMWLD